MTYRRIARKSLAGATHEALSLGDVATQGRVQFDKSFCRNGKHHFIPGAEYNVCTLCGYVDKPIDMSPPKPRQKPKVIGWCPINLETPFERAIRIAAELKAKGKL